MRPTSSAGMAHVDQTSLVRRTSTPTGDRSTPVNRRGSGNRSNLAGPRRTSPTPDASGGTTVVASSSSRVTGLPPRTPYRVARTRVAPLATPAGMNELEGAVLLEADDYRKISNDVKSLKTALLKLKRELQSDVSLSVALPCLIPSPAWLGTRLLLPIPHEIFKGENFRGFVAICKSFLYKIWECGIL